MISNPISILALPFVIVLTFNGVFGDPMESCQPRNATYTIADSKQCDMYFECPKSGKMIQRLCDDGFVYSIEYKQCDYPHNVDCTKRPNLQPTTSKNSQCERANGFYAFPAEQSCNKFYHCLEGVAYEKTCPEGVIFDTTTGTCTHPDGSKRPGCSADIVLSFQCPNAGKKFSKLRFGDHERYAHPRSCRLFIICLTDGMPRLGGCQIGKVFNPKTGFCDKPKNVPSCESFYGNKTALELVEEQGEAEETHELNELKEDDPIVQQAKIAAIEGKIKKTPSRFSSRAAEEKKFPLHYNRSHEKVTVTNKIVKEKQ